METREAMIQKIIDVMVRGEYQDYGIRVHGEMVNVGDQLAASSHYDDDNDYGRLPGTCTIGITDRGFTPDDADDIRDAATVAIDLAAKYAGTAIVLVGGRQVRGDYEGDIGEMLIADAVALAAWSI